MHNSLFCCIKKFKLTLYMYLCPNVCYTCMPFIYVDVIPKTILAVTLFSIILLRVCQRLVCHGVLLQDCLPVKFKDPKFMKFSLE